MRFLNSVVRCLVAVALVACSGGGGSSGVDSGFNAADYATAPNNFKVLLTDAPRDDLKEVNVNIKHVELVLERDGQEGRLLIAQNLGMLNLLTLRNGVTLPLAELSMPDGITVKQIRMVLESTDNHAIKSDDSRCELRTPSATKTGIKIILNQPVTFESESSYSMLIDFDALKSVNVLGNGDCLLKPVLKLPSFTKVDRGDVILDDPVDVPEEDLVDGDDGNTDGGDDSGFEEYEDYVDPIPVIGDPNDL